MTGSVLMALAGCNRYALFVVADGRGGDPGAADVLFVVDNSDSMLEESFALADSFDRFARALGAQARRIGTDGLPDAVDRYVAESVDPGAFVDFQLALTTIDAPDTAGALVGDPPLVSGDDPDLAERFVRNLACEAACFPNRGAVPSDPGYACDDPRPASLSAEYLDCLCGVDAWVGHCGTANEQGLEAVYAAMCRALPDPPPSCFDEGLDPALAGSNAGLLRPGRTFVPVVVSDEGDHSPRIPGIDAVPTAYHTLFAEIGVPMVWVVVAPELDADGQLTCPAPTDSWGVYRYAALAEASGGLAIPLYGPDCGLADWGATLDRIGDIVAGGVRSFVLPSAPVPTSIAVQVDGRKVDRSSPDGRDVFGEVVWTDGWSWVPENNAVVLKGDAVPGPGEEVVIWYLPRHSSR